MPGIGTDPFGPDGDQFAPLLLTPGAPLLLLGSASGLVGPVDAGSVTVTITQSSGTQGDATFTLDASDGAGSQVSADGVHADLLATFPRPLPTGFVYGPVALQWTCTVAGVSQSLGQALVITTEYTPLVPDENGVYSVTQGDTGPPDEPYSLLFYVPAELAAGLTGATLKLCPKISGMPFLPDPAASLDGSDLALDTPGLTPPSVRLTFPAGWGPNELGAGLWKAFARLSYGGVVSQTIPLYPVLPAASSRSKADYDAANPSAGVLSVWGLAGLTSTGMDTGANPPSPSVLALLTDLQARIAALPALDSQPAHIDGGTL